MFTLRFVKFDIDQYYALRSGLCIVIKQEASHDAVSPVPK